MFTWKRTKEKKERKGHQTPGKQKNSDTCQATTQDRYMASRNRSHKHKNYAAWAKKTKALND